MVCAVKIEFTSVSSLSLSLSLSPHHCINPLHPYRCVAWSRNRWWDSWCPHRNNSTDQCRRSQARPSPSPCLFSAVTIRSRSFSADTSTRQLKETRGPQSDRAVSGCCSLHLLVLFTTTGENSTTLSCAPFSAAAASSLTCRDPLRSKACMHENGLRKKRTDDITSSLSWVIMFIWSVV